VAWGTQLALFLLGAYAVRAHDCHVTLGESLYLFIYIYIYIWAPN
jgi:hypothetical protein